MFLSQLVDMPVCVGKNTRAFCQGVGISLKTYAVKYLLCANAPNSRAYFALPVSAVEEIGDGIRVSRLRPVLPKNCACVFLSLPVYAFDGGYLGKLIDMEVKNFVATALLTDEGGEYPVSGITACSDAILLKKEQPFPLGQRVPAPFLPIVTDKGDAIVTRPLLRTAMRKNALVKLTLSLPPVSLELI